jgi:hypothetical protein
VYRGRVARVAGSGLVLGRQGLFLTVTAPGAAVHHIRPGVVCRCTPEGGVDLATWNPSAGKRFNRLLRDLSRFVGANVVTYDTAGKRHEVQGLAYFKGAEVQRRGALHFHILVRRLDGAPLAITATDFRRLAVAHGFGHSVDVQPLTAQHAAYVSKYVAKSANDRAVVPWSAPGWARPVNPAHKVVPVASVEAKGKHSKGRMLARSVVDRRTGEVIGPATPALVTRPGFRTWSAARAWGDTMATVRRAQQHFVLCMAELPVWASREASRGWACLDVPRCPDLAVP